MEIEAMSSGHAHPDKPWDWEWLSKAPGITMSDVAAHLDKPWDWSSLSGNTSITITVSRRLTREYLQLTCSS